MNLVSKLEQKITEWLKKVPHLPVSVRKWLGLNIWWVALIGAIISAISVLFGLVTVAGVASVVGTVAATYYASATFTTWAIVTSLLSLVFTLLYAILLAMAVTPLRARQKKGWVLLFLVWLIGVVSVIVNSIVSLNPVGFIFGILFGAIWIAISGYFLFEIHNEFAHTEKSKGVKKAKA
jgi:uncharacterized membrane protein YhaH (DUF805 family)